MVKINVDSTTVSSFGAEWTEFSQEALSDEEHSLIFDQYFRLFPWKTIPESSEGFDMGCGSGRWAKLVAPRVGKLNCIDPAPQAIEVAKKNLRDCPNVMFYNATTSDHTIAEASQDFGYSLGVLHHIPDTQSALNDCTRMLKSGAPFLLYLYFKFDNKPAWYRLLWRVSSLLRLAISRLPNKVKPTVTTALAYALYLPLARMAWLGEKVGLEVDSWPLSSYRHYSTYTMKTDSRDRFGTPLEQRFTQVEIRMMMENSGLTDVTFSSERPYWCAVGFRR